MIPQINIESVTTLTKEQLNEAIVAYLHSGNINVVSIESMTPQMDQRNDCMSGVKIKLVLGGSVRPTTTYRSTEGLTDK